MCCVVHTLLSFEIPGSLPNKGDQQYQLIVYFFESEPLNKEDQTILFRYICSKFEEKVEKNVIDTVF